MKKAKKIAAWLICIYVFVMIVGTVATRVVYTFVVPEVSTVNPRSRNLQYEYSAQGVVKETKEEGIYVPQGLICEEIPVSIGQYVNEGDILVRFRENDIYEAINKLQEKKYQLADDNTELAKMRLGIKNGEADLKRAENELHVAEIEAKLTQKEKKAELLQSLNEQKDELTDSLVDADEAWDEEHAAFEKKIERAQKVLSELIDERNIVISGAREYAELLNNPSGYNGNVTSRRNTLLDVFRLIMYGGEEGYQEHRDEVIAAVYSSTPISLTRATRKDTALSEALSRYAKKLRENEAGAGNEVGTGNGVGGISNTEENGDDEEFALIFNLLYGEAGYAAKKQALENAADDVAELSFAAENAEKKHVREEAKIQKSLDMICMKIDALNKGEYDFKKEVEAVNEKITELRKEVEAAADRCDSAYETNELTLGYVTRHEAENAEKANELHEKEGEYEKLLADGCAFRAESAGRVLKCNLVSGERYTGDGAAFRLGVGESELVAEFGQEAEGMILEGSEAMVCFTGKVVPIKGVVSSTRLTDDGKICACISIDESDKDPEVKSASVTIKKKRDFCDACIPKETIHSDALSNYVFVVKTRDKIFGKEKFIQRINIDIICEDSEGIAVTGITSSDDVVLLSSKEIKDGSRVK